MYKLTKGTYSTSFALTKLQKLKKSSKGNGKILKIIKVH